MWLVSLRQIGSLTGKFYNSSDRNSTLVWVVQRSNPRMSYHLARDALCRLEQGRWNRDNFPGSGPCGRPFGSSGGDNRRKNASCGSNWRGCSRSTATSTLPSRRCRIRPGSDVLQVQRLKKRKLYLRDRISFIEDQLTPDIIA